MCQFRTSFSPYLGAEALTYVSEHLWAQSHIYLITGEIDAAYHSSMNGFKIQNPKGFVRKILTCFLNHWVMVAPFVSKAVLNMPNTGTVISLPVWKWALLGQAFSNNFTGTRKLRNHFSNLGDLKGLAFPKHAYEKNNCIQKLHWGFSKSDQISHVYMSVERIIQIS